MALDPTRQDWDQAEPDEPTPAPAPAVLYVNAYSVGRCYGGPEEGGWWFDTGSPLASVPIPADATDERIAGIREDLTKLLGWAIDNGGMGRSSVLGGDDFEIYVEDHQARPFPESRPHYE